MHGLLLLPSEAVRGRQHLPELRQGAVVCLQHLNKNVNFSPFLPKAFDERKKKTGGYFVGPLFLGAFAPKVKGVKVMVHERLVSNRKWSG